MSTYPRVLLNVSVQPISLAMSLILSADGREREIRVNIGAIRGDRRAHRWVDFRRRYRQLQGQVSKLLIWGDSDPHPSRLET